MFKRFWIFIIILVLSLSVFPSISLASAEYNAKDTFENYRNADYTGINQYNNSVIRVVIGREFGTGFLVSDGTDMKIITVAHILQHSNGVYGGNVTYQFSYRLSDNTVLWSRLYPASIYRIDTRKDVAVLTINNQQEDNWLIEAIGKPLIMVDKTFSKGEKVSGYGYPLPLAEPKVYEGTFIKNLTYTEVDTFGIKRQLIGIEFAMLAKPGDSGGPLVNSDGYVVGVVCSSDSNVTCAVTIEDVLNLLDN